MRSKMKAYLLIALIAVMALALALAVADRPGPSAAPGPRLSRAQVTSFPSAGATPATAGPVLPSFDQKREWALTYLRAPALWAITEGAGIRVAVVDTGVDTTQPDLAGAVVKVIGPAGDQSRDSHGTAVAGLIAGRGSVTDPLHHVAGLAPLAKLIDIRVTSQPGAVTATEIADGITMAVQAGARVINVSLGVAQDHEQQIGRAVNLARAHGCLVVASAGTGSAPQYPAASPEVLAVAATNQGNASMASLASYAPWALYAPGADLYSTAETGDSGGGHGGYIAGISGNDYATAYVSAAAALILSADPGLSGDEARAILVPSASPLPGAQESGILDPFAALGKLPSRPQPPIPVSPSPPGGQTATAHASSRSSSRASGPTPASGFRLRLIEVIIGLVIVLLVVLFFLWFSSAGGPRPPPGRRVERTASTWEAW